MESLDDAAVAPTDETGPNGEGARATQALGENVRRLRKRAGLTLETLSSASGVSRAMLSSVERGEKSPTLAVLTGIARGLAVTLTQLMGEDVPATAATVIRRDKRLVFRDPQTAVERHLLSPTHVATGAELIEHVLPPETRFPGGPQDAGVTDKHVVVREGVVEVRFGSVAHRLEAQDALHFRVGGHYEFFNPGDVTARYYIFIVHRS